MPKVRYVEDITLSQRVERELALFKVSASPGAARTEVVQLADMFRARIVDVSGESQHSWLAS
jgi:acetolactate synthase I/III small subunit